MRDKPIPKELIVEWLKYAPMITCNVVILNEDKSRVLLLLRKNEPARGRWFTPGGIIVKGSWLPIQVHDILRDEIGTTAPILVKPICVDHEFFDEGYGAQDIQLITIVYCAYLPNEKLAQVVINEDHFKAGWWSIDSLPSMPEKVVKWINIACGIEEWRM